MATLFDEIMKALEAIAKMLLGCLLAPEHAAMIILISSRPFVEATHRFL